MVKDAPTIPPDTFVDDENWEELKSKGLVFGTNVFDYTPYSIGFSGAEFDRTRLILEWELGEDRVFEGWTCIDGKPVPPDKPHPFYGPADDTGYYYIPPSEGWTPYWESWLDYDHPAFQEAGISHLLEPGDDFLDIYKLTWEVWYVTGSEDRFRCWGPNADPETKFEGTLTEVIDHIKTWETAGGEEE